jgi:hypothetical protein
MAYFYSVPYGTEYPKSGQIASHIQSLTGFNMNSTESRRDDNIIAKENLSNITLKGCYYYNPEGVT